jgi:Telomerase activating protein Est1
LEPKTGVPSAIPPPPPQLGSLLDVDAYVAQGKSAFRDFLVAARRFYEKLLKDLQEVYGNKSFATFLPLELRAEAKAAADEDVVESVYRCLICLGDLSRCADV